MLILRRSLLFLGENENKLLLNLKLDTVAWGWTASLNRFFKGEFIWQKPWIGVVHLPTGKFEIQRTGTGLLRSNISFIQIKGRVIADGLQEKIELKFGTPWYGTLNFIGLLLFVGVAIFLIEENWVSVIILSLLAIQILLLLVELNTTENKFLEYLEKNGVHLKS
jgi:hypothetical protein